MYIDEKKIIHFKMEKTQIDEDTKRADREINESE